MKQDETIPGTFASEGSALPLSGIRVLDFTWGGAGPFATKTLADFGAEVIKVETETRLDFPRTTGPYQNGVKGINRSGYFSNRNSSKRAVTLNFKAKEAVQLALRLAEKSDFVVNNFRAGVLDKLGLGYSAVSQVNPEVIYVSMPLQGTTGPQAHYSGIGHTLNALAGIYAVTGYEDGTIAGPGTNFPDHSVNPGHATVAMLAALRHRRRTGQGQYIEVSQLESSATLLGPYFADYSLSGKTPGPSGNTREGAAPYGAFPCRDGRWCVISICTQEDWQHLCEYAAGQDWTGDPDFSTQESRWRNREPLNARIGDWTVDQDARELVEGLQERGVAAGIVQGADDLVDSDPQTRARGSFAELDHPEMGPSLYNAAPYKFTGIGNDLKSPAPLLGQHNKEIFQDLLGLSDEEIAALEEKDVFK